MYKKIFVLVAFDGDVEKLKTILQKEDPSKPDSAGYTALV